MLVEFGLCQYTDQFGKRRVFPCGLTAEDARHYHSVEIAGQRYHVATLRPVDPMADALVPDLYEPVLLHFAVAAFRLRGFERVEVDGGHVGVVQEWHCEEP